MDSVKIGYTGESIVVQALNFLGFKPTVWDTKNPGSSDIEAIGGSNGKKIIVQVKSCVLPNIPALPSNNENANMKARANRIGCEGWIACVTLNQQLQLVGKINWIRVA